MIRGAFILALGFTLGYAKAIHEQDDIRDGVTDAVASIKNFFEEAQRADSEMTGQDVSGSYVGKEGAAQPDPGETPIPGE